MTTRHQELSDEIIASFKGLLSESVRNEISQSQWDHLTLMIRKALSDELGAAVERMEEVTRHIRANIEAPELGL